ncbi:MAG: hypothetical protein NTZ48_00470, partial [Candidatus Omnitrophica bacterium]|nr:hypothetical protein [Candidatus Omnitrophota bacterium]
LFSVDMRKTQRVHSFARWYICDFIRFPENDTTRDAEVAEAIEREGPFSALFRGICWYYPEGEELLSAFKYVETDAHGKCKNFVEFGVRRKDEQVGAFAKIFLSKFGRLFSYHGSALLDFERDSQGGIIFVVSPEFLIALRRFDSGQIDDTTRFEWRLRDTFSVRFVTPRLQLNLSA